MTPRNKWFLKKEATPKERKLYVMAVRIYDRGRNFTNEDLRRRDGTHRTNITQHLAHMVKKGMFRKIGRIYYAPTFLK